MEEERREHVAKMKKMEMEMEQVFEMKVKEKVQKLKDSEAEVSIVVAERLLVYCFLNIANICIAKHYSVHSVSSPLTAELAVCEFSTCE